MVYWGVDSLDFIQNQSGAVSRYFTNKPTFWGRYVNPAPANGLQTDSATEAVAAKNIGIGYIHIVTAPYPVNATSQQAQSDGNTACANVRSAINNANSHLALPTNQQLRMYLDVEAGYYFTATYWNGWSGAVDGYVDPHCNCLPYYPGCYCDPADGTSNPCGLFNNTNNNYCWGVWSSEPSYSGCGNCTIPGPAWGSQLHCSGCYTVLWQYVIAGSCSGCVQNGQGYPNVDLDQSTPGENEESYMLRVQ